MTTLKVGDNVVRMFASVLPMIVCITQITCDKIICGAWEFDRKTGNELGGKQRTVSYLILDKDDL